MTTRETPDRTALQLAEWPFPVAAALGSSVRADGIQREIKARLAFPDRKRLSAEDGLIRLRIPAGDEARFAGAQRIVAQVLAGIGTLPVLPSEAEDILAISSRERLKWTKDGRLQSAGTRTVQLRGRARTVTFHVFDPSVVEDVLDRDLVTIWREEDAAATAEARRRAASKAALKRRAGPEGKAGETGKVGKVGKPGRRSGDDASSSSELVDWSAFEAAGPLR
ncbi:hypothetical protein ASG43_10875 [Aureimonas sp. Leaf454]|uniref:hypothetical protein n=1 Tax=Aureimonas sp. Leaf454 TaxID=1736381 RepID=UPI0006F497C7|nr:hypothetical protein [Aureimonas sp. Leaf454]KQT47572.1 hypothetical protein ASG43_10875 [Aureimonas sp. Leaf454]